MKKLILFLLFSSVFGIIHAQNIQFLYGYGNEQPVNIVTVEIFRTLEHGALYCWTDFQIDGDGYFNSYTEISKYWNVGKDGYAVTAQYNTGIFADGTEAIRIEPVYLLGVQRAFKVGEWNLSLDILYRHEQFTSQSGVQATFAFIKEWNKFLFSGYCDIWNSGEYALGVPSTGVIFEPQLFYFITKRIGVGIEGRLSNYTLLTPYKDYIMGGIRWNLD